MVTPIIHTYTLGDLDTNSYIVECPITRQCLVIDPAAEGDFLSEEIVSKNLQPTAILLTHGHYDHVLGLLPLQLNFAVPIYLHPADTFLLERAEQTAKHFGSSADPVPHFDQELFDGQTISCGEFSLRVIHTPGHTPGSVFFVSENVVKNELLNDSEEKFLFCGDSLFENEYASTNHAYSSSKKLKESLKKILTLPPHTLIYSGHGDITTIGSQRQKYPNLSPTSGF